MTSKLQYRGFLQPKAYSAWSNIFLQCSRIFSVICVISVVLDEVTYENDLSNWLMNQLSCSKTGSVWQAETCIFHPLLSCKMGLRFKIPDCEGHRLCLFSLELGHYSLFLYILFLILWAFRLLMKQRLHGLLMELEPSRCIDFKKEKGDQLKTYVLKEFSHLIKKVCFSTMFF